MIVSSKYYRYMKTKIKMSSDKKSIPPKELLHFITQLTSENIILLWEQLINDDTVWKTFSVLCQYNSIFLSVLLRELYCENPKSAGAALLLYDLSGGYSAPYKQRYLELFATPSTEFKDIIDKL